MAPASSTLPYRIRLQTRAVIFAFINSQLTKSVYYRLYIHSINSSTIRLQHSNRCTVVQVSSTQGHRGSSTIQESFFDPEYFHRLKSRIFEYLIFFILSFHSSVCCRALLSKDYEHTEWLCCRICRHYTHIPWVGYGLWANHKAYSSLSRSCLPAGLYAVDVYFYIELYHQKLDQSKFKILCFFKELHASTNSY